MSIGIEGLMELINHSPKELKIVCNDGEISIDTNTFNFTYVGKFGQMVSNHIIRKGVCNDIPLKLLILNTHIDIYRTKIGELNIYQN